MFSLRIHASHIAMRRLPFTLSSALATFLTLAGVASSLASPPPQPLNAPAGPYAVAPPKARLMTRSSDCVQSKSDRTSFIIADACRYAIDRGRALLLWEWNGSQASGFNVYIVNPRNTMARSGNTSGEIVRKVPSGTRLSMVSFGHCFAVTAFNSVGESPLSNIVCTGVPSDFPTR